MPTAALPRGERGSAGDDVAVRRSVRLVLDGGFYRGELIGGGSASRFGMEVVLGRPR